MRALSLLLALLCLMGCSRYCGGLSTCKPLNLELMKRKRIEAIRGQILSKLRLTKEPEGDEEGEEDEVPAEVLSIYNSTMEIGTDDPGSEEEAYYAKEVHKFNMNKTAENGCLMFDIPAMKSMLGTGRLISQAELRLFIKGTNIPPGTEQRLELYQRIIGNKTRYLSSHFITNEHNEKWISFDVTQTLNLWLQSSETEQALQVKLHCECDEKNKNMLFHISGISIRRGDTGILPPKMIPHILVMSLPADLHSHLSSRRKRQTLADEVCSEQSENCCVRRLYIDFRKDLGWKWIHEPSGYYANYCIGSCSFVWNAENKYSQVLALYKHHNPGASAQPCCVPQVLDPLPILYYVGRQHKVEHLSNMIVKTCKCS